MAHIKAENEQEQKYFDYLEELRQSGDTNMWGAGAYLREEFPGLSKHDAGAILLKWMGLHSDSARVIP